MTLTFNAALTIQDQGQIVADQISMGPTSALTVTSGGLLEVPGVLNSLTPVTVDGGTFMGSQLIAPAVSVIHGGLLTSETSTASQMYKLELDVTGTLSVDSSSKIDVSGKGYLPGYTTGNTTEGGVTGIAGGSYGGLGSAVDGTPNAVYGDYADPSDWGSGGGKQPGGGLVRIVAATLTLDGQLLADGFAPVNNVIAGGGSGGGIYVAVDHLQGTGLIGARGGDAGNYGDFYGGSGGGGRIALFTPDSAGFDTSKITAQGGYGAGAWNHLPPRPRPSIGTLVIRAGGISGWTPLGLPGQNSVVITDNVVIADDRTRVRPEHPGMTLTFNAALTIQDQGQIVADQISMGPTSALAVTSGEVLEVPGILNSRTLVTVDGGTFMGSQLSAPAVSVIHGGLLTSETSTASQMYKLELDVTGTLSVDSSSKIDVSGKGYLPGYTTGNTTEGGVTGIAGGSYGGLGSAVDGTPNAVYGDYADPSDWGSGGGKQPGGGLVRIVAATLTLDGQLLADGLRPVNPTTAGGGAGGGIYVAVDHLQGAGLISARGGDAGNSGDFFGGSGGGGRIALFTPDLAGFDTSRITAQGGYGAGAGTVWIVQAQPRAQRALACSGRSQRRDRQSGNHIFRIKFQ